MTYCSRKVKYTSNHLQDVGFGSKNTIAHINGSTKRLGQKYRDCLVILFSKYNFQPIAVCQPNINGQYEFLGLNTDITTFIVAFDQNQQYNAVIQDNVVPK